jgi:5-methylcytosine-specific restriction endonuclease McrA
MAQVLVLNQDYQALAVCEPQRALILVLGQKAEMIAEVAGRKFRSVRQEFDFPSVIRLFTYVQFPYRRVAMTRENIFRRDRYQCVYCGSTRNLTLDHVVPRSKGGGHRWDNLVTACRKCNAQKGDLSPAEAGLSLACQPYRPSFIMYLGCFAGLVQEDWKPYLFL